MTTQSNSSLPFGLDSAGVRKLADELVKTLTEGLAKSRRTKWTANGFDVLRNFRPLGMNLQEFCRLPDSKGQKRGEFLWDYIAYEQGEGILLAVESEWDFENEHDLKHDFEKLLYVNSPLKLMLCRATTGAIADDIARKLGAYANEAFSHFGPGEIYILYCRVDSPEQSDKCYLWQDSREPTPRPTEPMNLSELEQTISLS